MKVGLYITFLEGNSEQHKDLSWLWYLAFRYYVQDNKGEVDLKSGVSFVKEYLMKILPERLLLRTNYFLLPERDYSAGYDYKILFDGENVLFPERRKKG